MDEFDVFDILGIKFDPPEAKDLPKKLKQKIKELGSDMGRSSQQTQKAAIKAQKDYLEGVARTILSEDGEKVNAAALKTLAGEKIEKKKREFRTIVSLRRQTGKKTVTEGTIQEFHKSTKLSPESIRDVLQSEGIQIVKITPKALPKFPTNAERTYTDLAALRLFNDPRADTSQAVDLYGFAAYVANDGRSADAFRAMSTAELSAFFDAASKRFSKRNDDMGKISGSIAAAAKTNVFNSEDNRKAYATYLLYKSESLVALFNTIKGLSKFQKESPEYAEPCISTIFGFFPDRDMALGIYNKEAGVEYIPPEVKYLIKCKYCGNVNEFPSEEDAKQKNACTNCRKELFRKCVKCGQLVPAFMDACPYPNCGYVFASAELFDRYYQEAEGALQNGDFDTARKLLQKARTSDPREKARTDELESRISADEERYKEPVNRLRRLIAARQYCTARTELSRIIGQFPNLNVSEFSASIDSAVKSADERFAAAAKLPPVDKADVCVGILMDCADHAPSLAYLQSTPPIPCAAVHAAADAASGTVNISWARSPEQEVEYRLLRKSGRDPSVSENDGTVLVEKTTGTSYTDTSVKPGQVYTYSVFLSRRRVFSAPASKTVVLYANVKNCHVVPSGKAVLITWDAPENSLGAKIERTADGKTTVLTQSAHGSYQDTGVSYGTTYIYRVSAVYGGNRTSSGVQCTITLMHVVDPFPIQAKHLRDDLYEVSWTIPQPGVALRIVVNDSVVSDTLSDRGAEQVRLPKETFCTLSVRALSGGKWISSKNSCSINTYTSCPLDKKASKLEETQVPGRTGSSYRVDFKLCLADRIPDNAVGFYYTIRSTAAAVRWAKLEEIGRAPDIRRVSVADYRQKGAIQHREDVQEDEASFFVSVFTIYQVGGKEIVSEAQRMRLERPLIANLFWGVTYNRLGGILTLSLELSGNRPVTRVPELVLCACGEKQYLMSHEDQNALVIGETPAVDLDTPSKNYRKEFIIKTSMNARELKKHKFFLFEKTPEEIDQITLRWRQGFAGKL